MPEERAGEDVLAERAGADHGRRERIRLALLVARNLKVRPEPVAVTEREMPEFVQNAETLLN